MLRTKLFRAYLVDDDQPCWHNRFVCWWGRKPKPRQTDKGIDHGDHPHELRFEWRAFSQRCGFQLGLQVRSEDDQGVTISFGLPWLFYLYITHSVSRRFTERVLPKSEAGGGWPLDRKLSISSFGLSLHYSLWTHPMDGGFGDYGRTKVAGWRDGIIPLNPLGLFGRVRCKTEIVEDERSVHIAMPEGEYPARLKVERRVWTRKLWPWWPLRREQVTHSIDCELGIPFSGKGENGWDCGEDGIYGTGFVCRDEHEACGLFAARALQYRARRGDPRVWPVSPYERKDLRARAQAEGGERG